MSCIPPYAVLHMHGLDDTLPMFKSMPPYICFPPYDLYRIIHMFDTISPYVVLHMVCMNCPHGVNRFCICWSPHGLHELSAWFTCVLHIISSISTDAFLHYYGFDAFLHIFEIMSPYAVLHTLYIAFSTWFSPCLHMLLSTWFAWNFPHAKNRACICCCPHGLHGTLHMFSMKSAYAFLHMVELHVSSCLEPYITRKGKTLRTHCTIT